MVLEEQSLTIFGKWAIRPKNWKSLKHKDSIIFYELEETIFVGEILAIYKVRSTGAYVISVGRIPPPYNYWYCYTRVKPQNDYFIKDFIEISKIRSKGYLIEFPSIWYISDTVINPSVIV